MVGIEHKEVFVNENSTFIFILLCYKSKFDVENIDKYFLKDEKVFLGF